jgi:hypothetical protein
VSLGFAWPLQLLTGDVESSTPVAVALAALIVAGLWRQGRRRARGVGGSVAIARSFRAGLVVFTWLLAFETAGTLDLGTRVAMGPFFVSGLLAMALARAPVHGVTLRAWLGLIAVSIIVIVVSGFALALLAVAVVRGGFGALRDVWLQLANAVDRSVSETLVELLGNRAAGAVDLQSASPEPSQALVLLVLLLGAMVFAPLLYRLLNAPPPLQLPQIALDLGSAEHESIGGGDSEASGQLLEALLARWPWRRRAGAELPALPAQPDLARACVLYYELLERAQARGIAINPAHTPRERRAALCVAFPGLPVARLTAVFEAACYARQAAPRAELDRLREQCAR